MRHTACSPTQHGRPVSSQDKWGYEDKETCEHTCKNKCRQTEEYAYVKELTGQLDMLVFHAGFWNLLGLMQLLQQRSEHQYRQFSDSVQYYILR